MEHITDISHEEIPANVHVQKPNAEPLTVDAEEVSVEVTIKNELARFDKVAANISEMVKKYQGLKIAGPEDKDGYKKVKAAWQEVRNTRLAVEKKRKEIKDDYVKIGKAIDGKAKEYSAPLEPLEDELRNEWGRIDQIEEERKNQAEREAQERLQGRVVELIDNGMAFNGSYYTIGETISMDAVTLKAMPADKYAEFLAVVKKENTRILEEKASAERKAAEERAEFERQQAKLKEEREAMDRQREEMERQQKEMKEQRTNMRKEVLKNAGFEPSDFGGVLTFSVEAGKVSVSFREFEDLTGDEWDRKFFELRAKRDELKKAQQELEDNREAERLKAEKIRQEEEARAEAERERLEELRTRTHARQLEILQLFPGIKKSEGYLYRIFQLEAGPGAFRIAFTAIEETPDGEPWTMFINTSRDSWEAMEQLEEENNRYKAQKAEEARQAALSDAEKIQDFLNAYAGIKPPQLTSDKAKAAFTAFDLAVAKAMETMLNNLEAAEL